MDYPKKLLNRAWTILMTIIILTWFAAPAFGAGKGSKNGMPFCKLLELSEAVNILQSEIGTLAANQTQQEGLIGAI